MVENFLYFIIRESTKKERKNRTSSLHSLKIKVKVFLTKKK